jgi:hypothetical protein
MAAVCAPPVRREDATPPQHRELLGAAPAKLTIAAPAAADSTARSIAGWSEYVRDCLVAVDEAPTSRNLVTLRVAVKAASDALAQAGAETPDADKRILKATLAIANETLEAHRAHAQARVEIVKIQRAFQTQLDRRGKGDDRNEQYIWANATWSFFSVWKPRLERIAPNLSATTEAQLADAVGNGNYESVAAVLRALIASLDALPVPAKAHTARKAS